MKHPSVIRGITIAAFIAASLAHGLMVAGRAEADQGVATEALAPGSWSVQFSVQPNFTLGSYSGSTLSLKRHLASGNALRFGVSVDLGGVSDDFGYTTADTFATQTQLNAVDGNTWSIGLGAYYLWYMGRAAPLHAYWGAGPTISLSRGHTDQTQSQTMTFTGQPPNTSVRADDIRNHGWQVGMAATAGIEWLVARRIGLFAEYGSSLAYTNTTSTRRTTTTLTGSSARTETFDSDTHRWAFSGSGGRLGVSAYY
jgi:hypothetical protein